MFERIDYDYDTIRYSGCKSQYKFYVQGLLNGMRFMSSDRDIDKDVMNKLLSLNMYKETEEMYEMNIDESNPHPINIYFWTL